MSIKNAATIYQEHADRQLHLQPATIRSRVGPFDTLTVHDWVHLWIRDALPTGGRALDIGCAQLQLLLSLGSNFSRLAGVDIAECNSIWERHPHVETHVMDLDRSNLPFDDESFELVAMTMVLEHVFDPFHAVAEVRRVLAPNGFAVIQVPNLAGIRHRITLARGQLPITSTPVSFDRQWWDGQHLHNFTQGSLTWLLRTVGLEPDSWGVSGRAAILRAYAPNLLGQDLIVRCRPTQPQPGLRFCP